MGWCLQHLESESFIREFWQKKPCLVRQAFPGLVSPVTPEELAGLACEEEVHSRLVLENDGGSHWELRYGPFEESDFLSLPESHYSLLVSECEKWLPGFADLLGQFHFLPAWRLDDIMVSYAPPGGSVGPHTDEYDVFLIQVQGRRNWRYGLQRIDEPNLLPGLDLAIMTDFVADEEFILAPGDMLYLPPGIAHHGVAVDACMTCSVGFRAPTALEVMESFIHEVDDLKAGGARYSDPDLESNRHSAQITDSEIDRFVSLATNLLEQPRAVWRNAIGKLLSDSLVSASHSGNDTPSSAPFPDGDWVVNPSSKLLYYHGGEMLTLFHDGQASQVPYSPTRLDCLQKLCAGQPTRELLECLTTDDEMQALLMKLTDNGTICASACDD